ncbi:AAA family ATPase [Candidatus Saccharibacteria bacterium]|jgi:dephospho-CoA kinase|nr:AAA family ATPase [Candidatus Saccharibacteria bacterium]
MSTLAKPVIIGLAGTFASGKDSLARALEEKFGICHISTGDIVRKFAMEKYGSIERPILYKTANWLREKHGAGALSHMALEEYNIHKEQYPSGVCVSGFRAWEEAKVIKNNGGIIVFTDAPQQLRYDRTITRARDNEKLSSFEEFKKREDAEDGGVNSKFSIAGIKKHADIVIDNDKNLDDFLNEAIKKIGL